MMEFIKKYYGVFAIAVAVLALALLFQTCSDLKTERAQREYQDRLYAQNMNAMKDSITVEFNKKLNAFDFSKQTYMVDKFNELEKYNAYLYNELKKVKGDILNALDTKLKIDVPKLTLGNKLEILNKNQGYYGLRFKSDYSDEGFEQTIGGSSRFYANYDEKIKSWTIKPDNTILDTNQMSMKILYGTRKKDNGYEVFAISKSPIVKFTEMEGAYFVENQVVRPTFPKKWGLSPYVGIGINTDFNLTNPRPGWSIGIAVTYDLVQWRMPWDKK
jgi:hypothetical protein